MSQLNDNLEEILRQKNFENMQNISLYFDNKTKKEV